MARGDDTPKKKRGRPKGKPLSEAEQRQREAAAWKNGRHSGKALGMFRPCSPKQCPLGDEGFPCEARRLADAQGDTLERCTVDLALNSDARALYLEALQTGDLGVLDDLTARALGGLADLHASELQLLLRHGLTAHKPLYSKEGDHLGDEPIANPAAKPFLELTRVLGLTATDQALTRRSAGERARDVSVAGALDWIADVNAQAAEKAGGRKGEA
ncbi:MAG: hypothetical protein AAGD06_27025 [Acidobacteriota bacterium]